MYDRRTSDLTSIEYPFIIGHAPSPCGQVPLVSTTLSFQDRIGALKVRSGFSRDTYRVVPGLYGTGQPNGDSPLLVTANYKLTFDSLRKELAGHNCWILVLDTEGINVWCAAGKGTFGTENLIRALAKNRADRLVAHRTVILPQLGAPGVSGYKVTAKTGFKVVFGPVRAADLPAFFRQGQKADAAMREVTFGLADRLVLTLIELDHAWKIALATAGFSALTALPYLQHDMAMFFRTVGFNWIIYLTAILIGTVAVPAALPFIPFRSFIMKGYIAALPLTLMLIPALYSQPGFSGMSLAGLWLCAATASAWQSLNFTGSTVYTGHSGVRREISLGIRPMALLFTLGFLLQVLAAWKGGS